MLRRSLKVLFLLLCFTEGVIAINRDSLTAVLEKEISDRERFEVLLELSGSAENKAQFRAYMDQAWILAKTIRNDTLKIRLHYKEGLYHQQFQEDEYVLDQFLKALRMAESLSDSVHISRINYSLGSFYFWKNELPNAEQYFKASVETFPSYSPEIGKATPLMAMGVVVVNQKKFKEALVYQSEAINIKKRAGAFDQLPISYNNLAGLYFEMGNYSKSFETLDEAIALGDSLGQKDAVNYAQYAKGEFYSRLNDFKKAAPYLKESIRWWEENGYTKDLPNAYTVGGTTFLNAGLYYDAAIAFQKLSALKDSLTTTERQEALMKLETQYQTEKKELELEKQKKEKELAEAEKELAQSQKRQQRLIFGILAVVLVINSIYFFRRYKIQKKDKEIIQMQKLQLEVRNKEIEDSINYAKRIQQAILPQEKQIKALLNESFVLYRPKDIVAGDFYWVEPSADGQVFFAACDCTGHGVPGAMVSVICNNGLNRSLKEKGITDPGKLLDETRQIVLKEFEKAEETVNDGMDVSLAAIKGNSLKWAGANNNLWIFRNGDLIELKGDKQPIGKYSSPKPFTTHSFELEAGDMLYMFTDGLKDQFGGQKGKKLKVAGIKQVLKEICNRPMQEQYKLIEEAFLGWKAGFEQVDDVCVIGVRVS